MLTVSRGMNADLIASVASLYLQEGMQVADVTYGKGVFWRKCQERRVTIWASDLKAIEVEEGQQDWLKPLRILPQPPMDFRTLAYDTGTFDIVVFDPPYIHNPGKHMTDARYNNAATTGGMYYRDIMVKLYYPGIREAARIVKPGGQLWVKGKDQVESSEQRWSHRDIYNLALTDHYFTAKDHAILYTVPPSNKRWDRQLHLRKNHSVLWIFERTEVVMGPKLILREKRGRPPKPDKATEEHKCANVGTFIKRGSNNRAYLLIRLERDYPDIFLRYHAREFPSVRAAAIAAGLVRPARKGT